MSEDGHADTGLEPGTLARGWRSGSARADLGPNTPTLMATDSDCLYLPCTTSVCSDPHNLCVQYSSSSLRSFVPIFEAKLNPPKYILYT